MAMNNWGGVKEHMTKKSRRFMGNKKVSRKLDSVRLHTKIDFSKEEKIRRKKIVKELWIYVLIFLGTILFLYFK